MNAGQIERWVTLSPDIYAHVTRLGEMARQVHQGFCVVLARVIEAAYEAGRYDRREEIIKWCTDCGFGVVASKLRTQQLREG